VPKIPWCAVTDEDLLPDGTVNPVTARDRTKIESKKTAADESAMWSRSLEATLGAPSGQKATPAWQAANIEPLSLTDLDAGYPDFMKVCRSLKAWIGG
jgi:hypothetical protein